MNSIFRYRLVSIYFILSQLVILTAIFGVLNTINKAYAKENDRLKALAKNRIELNIDTFAKKDILSYAAVNVDVGNVLAQGRMSVEVAQIGSTNDGFNEEFFEFVKQDPLFRKGMYNRVTYEMLYHYKEHFITNLTYEALKDDTLYAMVSGNDDKQRLSDIRAVLGYIYTYPGPVCVSCISVCR